MSRVQDEDFFDDDPTDEFPVLSDAVLLGAEPPAAMPPSLALRQSAPPAEIEALDASGGPQRPPTLDLSAPTTTQPARDSSSSELARADGEAVAGAGADHALHEARARSVAEAPEVLGAGPLLSGEARGSPVAELRAAREEIAALADYITLRQQQWHDTQAALEDARRRIRELELEVAHRMARERAAVRCAEAADERRRELAERLLKLEAARKVRFDAVPPIHDSISPKPPFGTDMAPADAPVSPPSAVAPPPLGVLARLVCLTSDPARAYTLGLEPVTIGRSTRCDIRLPTHFVSREHACLVAAAERWVVEDLGSKNGVFVNAIRVQSQTLRDGDLITIGDAQFRFDEDLPPR